MDRVLALYAGSWGFDSHRGTCPNVFPHPIDQDIRTQWALSWLIVVSEWRSVIAVSLNVDGGVRLIKPAKLYMCTHNTTNTTRTDARRRVCATMVPYRWATRGTSLRELEYTLLAVELKRWWDYYKIWKWPIRNFGVATFRCDVIASSGPEVIKLFSCSIKLSMKFFLLINVKMPTIVGILTFMSGKNNILGLSQPEKAEFLDSFMLMTISCSCYENFMFNWVEHEKSLITSGPFCL